MKIEMLSIDPLEWRPSGQCIPLPGKVISMVSLENRLFIAMEHGIYEFIDGKLKRILFEGEGEA